MRRRDLLRAGIGLGAVALAGCIGSGGHRTEGNDDDPLEADPGELLLPEAELDGGWTADDPEERPLDDPDAATTYFPFDGEEWNEDAGTVTRAVRLEGDVEAAREVYDGLPYHEGWGFEDREIAVESVGGTGDGGRASYVFFRDANGVGAVVYENPAEDEGSVEETGLELAVAMHESWRG